jgi:hypothetical protein
MLAPGAMIGFGDFRGTRALHAGRGSFKSLYSSEQASITGRFSGQWNLRNSNRRQSW